MPLVMSSATVRGRLGSFAVGLVGRLALATDTKGIYIPSLEIGASCSIRGGRSLARGGALRQCVPGHIPVTGWCTCGKEVGWQGCASERTPRARNSDAVTMTTRRSQPHDCHGVVVTTRPLRAHRRAHFTHLALARTTETWQR
ncbi:hypothetical protein OG21DRAFT_1039774 [Imleria badia]|nr:hypothetical protein OG21DRAFT_1039774 [Imleria badia]